MNFFYDADDGGYHFLLSGNQTYLNAYRDGTASSYYLRNAQTADAGYSYYELGNNVNIKAEATELTSYITSPVKEPAYVKYFINGVDLGVSYGISYSVDADFSAYKGHQINITVRANDSNHMEITSQTVRVNVI